MTRKRVIVPYIGVGCGFDCGSGDSIFKEKGGSTRPEMAGSSGVHLLVSELVDPGTGGSRK